MKSGKTTYNVSRAGSNHNSHTNTNYAPARSLPAVTYRYSRQGARDVPANILLNIVELYNVVVMLSSDANYLQRSLHSEFWVGGRLKNYIQMYYQRSLSLDIDNSTSTLQKQSCQVEVLAAILIFSTNKQQFLLCS